MADRETRSNGGLTHRGQTGPKGVTVEQIMAALTLTAGNILEASKKLKCSSQNIRQRIAASKELLEFCASLDEDVLDMAEGVIVHALRKNDATTARWLLDRKGKSRGIVERKEVTGPDGGAIQHAVTAQQVDPVTKEEIELARRRYFNDGDD